MRIVEFLFFVILFSGVAFSAGCSGGASDGSPSTGDNSDPASAEAILGKYEFGWASGYGNSNRAGTITISGDTGEKTVDGTSIFGDESRLDPDGFWPAWSVAWYPSKGKYIMEVHNRRIGNGTLYFPPYPYQAFEFTLGAYVEKTTGSYWELSGTNIYYDEDTGEILHTVDLDTSRSSKRPPL